MNTVRLVIRSLLIIEMITLFWYSLVGAGGIFALQEAKKINRLLKQEVLKTRDQIAKLEQYKEDWHIYPFYKEQFVREELQMIKPGEELYLYVD